MVKKAITFTQLLELVHQELDIEPQQHIQHLQFQCPIFESGKCYMYTSFIMRDDANFRQMLNIDENKPSLSFLELFAIICDNNNPPRNQQGSTFNLEDLSNEYKTCWVKNHGSDIDSSSEPKGRNMSPSLETIFQRDW